MDAQSHSSEVKASEMAQSDLGNDQRSRQGMSRKSDLASHTLQLLRAQMLCHSMPFLTNIKAAKIRQCEIRGRYHYVILAHERLLKPELPGGPQTGLQCWRWAQLVLFVGEHKAL